MGSNLSTKLPSPAPLTATTRVRIPAGAYDGETIELPSTNEVLSCSSKTSEQVRKVLAKTLTKQVLTPEILAELSCHELQDLVSAASLERKKRFRRRDRKYGNINKGFTQEELERFFLHCENPKAKLVFKIMSCVGLRIAEAASLQLSDINWKSRRLSVQTLKARTGDSLYLHDEILTLLEEWVRVNYGKIVESDGYLFYSDSPVQKRKYVSPDWLRNEFRRTIALASLDEWYSKSEESKHNRPSRKLHRLTTHSLRHYFITRVYNETKDIVVAQKLARHTDSKATHTYIFTAQTSLDESMKKVFEKGMLEEEKEIRELKRLRAILQAIR
jgi:integrase